MILVLFLAFTAPAAAQQLLLPASSGPWAPSGLEVRGDPAALGQVDYCLACHDDAAAHGRDSAHGQASLTNPWYLSSFDALRHEQGPEAVRHCGGCHDPALLVSGSLADADPSHPAADVGVPCLACHGAVSANPSGNGSLTVDVADLPDPVLEVDAHRARMQPAVLRRAEVCQGCHRGALVPELGVDQVLTGFDDWGAWQSSAWAGTDARRLDPAPARATCIDCHDHATGGGRTALDPDHLLHDAVTLFAPIARVDGVPVPLDGPFAPAAGAEVVVEAVVWNTGTGHRFPGGLADIHDVWLTLRVDDGHDAWTAQGPHLRSLPLDDEGRPVRDHRVHDIAVPGFDHTVPPGEAQVLRMGFVAPGGPIRVHTSLWHRPHRSELAEAGCEASTQATIDGCAEPTLTRIAEQQPPAPEAWYALGLGLSRGATEDLPQALAVLDHAEAEGLDADRVAVVRARVLGALGRADDALETLEGRPDHPAVHATRADALMAVWRFDEAQRALEQVVAAAPRYVRGWAQLARARGSLGDDRGALAAARHGLALSPRHPGLLRSQALAARALDHPEALAAEAAWLLHRATDGTNQLRMACDRFDDECSERGAIPMTWARSSSDLRHALVEIDDGGPAELVPGTVGAHGHVR